MIKKQLHRLISYLKLNHRSQKLMLVVISGLIGVAIIVVTIGAEKMERLNLARKDKLDSLHELTMIRSNLERELNKNLYQLGALVAYISINPEIDKSEFNVFAMNLFRQPSHISSLGAAPDMVVKYVYPFEANKAAIGLDYAKRPNQREMAFKVKELGKQVVAGPLMTVQGRYEIIGRAPVYYAEDNHDRKAGSFWGLVSILIDANKLFEAAGLYNSKYAISLRGKDAKGAEGDVLLGNPDAFIEENALLFVEVPGGSWQIAAELKHLADDTTREIVVIRLIGLFLCLAVLAFAVIRLRYLEERWAVNKQLEVALVEAEKASRAKSEFLANMSHELRTPLNAIIGFSELIQANKNYKASESKIEEYAGDINASGHHLLQIINDILDLSKVEAGNYSAEIEPVYLHEIVEQSLRLTKNDLEKNKLQLVNHVKEDLPPLRSDERLIKQIFLNILSNSIKFTPSGGQVVVFAGIMPDGAMKISLRDTGIGMSEDDLVIAMQNFGQAGSYLVRKQQGTGLGLPLVKAFVELLGGEFFIQSQVDVGTEITIIFPAPYVITVAERKLSYSH